MRSLSLIRLGLAGLVLLAACSSSGTFSPPDPPAVGAGGAGSGPAVGQGGASSGPSLGGGGAGSGPAVGQGGAASHPSVGGGGISSASSAGGSSGPACNCIKKLADAENAGYACLGHPGTCPGSTSGCGTLDSSGTSCAWPDGAKVTYPQGGGAAGLDFSVYGPGGALCFTQKYNSAGTASTIVDTFPDGTYSFAESASGATFTCPDGTSVGESEAEGCPGASSLSTSPSFCCVSGLGGTCQ